MHSIVAGPPMESPRARRRVAEAGDQAAERSAHVACRDEEGRRPSRRAGLVRTQPREHRRRVDLGVAAGRIGRRKRRGKPYTESAVRDYERSYRNFLRLAFGPMPADDIADVEWQMWVDELSREGLMRSRIDRRIAACWTWSSPPRATSGRPRGRSADARGRRAGVSAEVHDALAPDEMRASSPAVASLSQRAASESDAARFR
jgi:hypothetical protein